MEPNGKWAPLAVVVALVMTGCGSSRERSPTGHVSVATSKAQLENDPSKNASDSNTPRVGPIGSVEVDDLRWHLGYTPEVATYSLPLEAKILERAVANGIFIVVPLSVTDHKSESVRLTSELVSLVAGGKTYSMNRDAEAHLPGHMLSGEELGPNVGDVVEAVFDVAPEVLHERPELRFNELGFGTTHAYIELPPWHSGTGQIVAEAGSSVAGELRCRPVAPKVVSSVSTGRAGATNTRPATRFSWLAPEQSRTRGGSQGQAAPRRAAACPWALWPPISQLAAGLAARRRGSPLAARQSLPSSPAPCLQAPSFAESKIGFTTTKKGDL